MKKFFSAILLMTMMVFSVGTFVSCNDLVEEVETIKGQTTDIENAIAGLETEIAALETALQNAKAEAADAAKKAADAAAAADAKAADAAAAAAAAQAAADALAGQLETAQATLQAALDGKADVEDVEAAVKEIEALKAALDGKYDKTDAAALEARVKLLEDAVANYKTLIEELEIATGYNLEAITNLDFAFNQFKEGEFADLAEAVAELEELVNACNTNLTNYDAAILGIVEMIQSVVYVPEYVDGMMTATGYKLGNNESDIIVKATYEVTPAKYAAELTNANVAFRAVTVETRAAAAAETVPAEVVEAANGRVTLYARVKKNVAKKAYEALATASTDPAAALALVITDEASATVDSTDVTVGTNFVTEYTNVLSKGYVSVAGLVKSYNNVTKDWAKSDQIEDPNNPGTYIDVNPKVSTNTIKVPYTDVAAKTPLSVFELRLDIEGEKMTPAQASELLGYTVNPVPAPAAFTYDKPSTATVAAATPFTTADSGLASTVQLKATQALALKNAVGYSALVTISQFKFGNTSYNLEVDVAGKVVIDYAEIADISIETYDAGKWSYAYATYNSTTSKYEHKLVKNTTTNPLGIKELDVNSSIELKKLSYSGTALNDGAEINNVPMEAVYYVNGQEKKANGKVSFKVLNSKSLMITAIELPFVDQALTYKTNFQLINTSTSESYTVSFMANLAERPADKSFDFGTITYDGTIKPVSGYAVTVPVTPIKMIRDAHDSYYTDLFAQHTNATTAAAKETARNLINGKFTAPTAVQYTSPTAVLDTPNYIHNQSNSLVENTKVRVASVTEYGKEYSISYDVYFCGIKYTFTGKVAVNKPNYGIKVSSLLINPSTLVGEVNGKVVYPVKAAGSSTVANGSFTLDAIDLRNYVVITEDGENATKALLESGEFELKYEIITTYDDDDDASTPEVAVPGVTINNASSVQLPSSFAAASVADVDWTKGYYYDNTTTPPTPVRYDPYYSSTKFRVTLVSKYADVNVGTANQADATYGYVEFTLQIPDLVTLEATDKVETEEFVPGSTQAAVINVYKSIKVVDFNGKSLIGNKANSLTTLWAETTGGNQYQMYGQSVDVLNIPGVATPTAAVESTGDALYYGEDFEVTANGDVKLLATDLNIQSNVIVTVPLMLTHDYQDDNDMHVVAVKVKFTPKK